MSENLYRYIQKKLTLTTIIMTPLNYVFYNVMEDTDLQSCQKRKPFHIYQYHQVTLTAVIPLTFFLHPKLHPVSAQS